MDVLLTHSVTKECSVTDTNCILSEFSPICGLNGNATMSSSRHHTKANFAIDSADRDSESLFQPAHVGSTLAITAMDANQWWSLDLGSKYRLTFLSFFMPAGMYQG